MDENQFSRCPFCGSNDVDMKIDDGIWYVGCDNCGARGGNAYLLENAIVMWNERTGEGGST